MKNKAATKSQDELHNIFHKKEKKKAFSCRLDPEVLNLIKEASDKHGVSASEIIEGCVRHTLKDKAAT